jgi:hypothetical protein
MTGGGNLLLQRFAQLLLAAWYSRIRDDGLGRKIRKKGNLLIGEQPHLLPVDGDRILVVPQFAARSEV